MYGPYGIPALQALYATPAAPNLLGTLATPLLPGPLALPVVQPVVPAPPAATPPGPVLLEVRYKGPRDCLPSQKLYVKGVPAGTSSETVEGIFRTCGNVINSNVLKGDTDCIALVEMGSVEDATAAIHYLSGQPFGFARGPGPQGLPIQPVDLQSVAVPGQALQVFFQGIVLFARGLRPDITDTEVITVFSVVSAPHSVRIIAPIRNAQDASALVHMGSIATSKHTKEVLDNLLKKVSSSEQPNRPAAPAMPPSTPIVPGLVVRYQGPKNALPSDNLYVKGLPAWISEDQVREFFAAAGTVVSVKVMPPSEGAEDSTALVRMSSVAEASLAVGTLGDANGIEGERAAGGSSWGRASSGIMSWGSTPY